VQVPSPQVETPDVPSCLADDRVCQWVWDLSGNKWLAEAGAVAMTPLRILLILAAATLVRWLLRRAVTRLVRRAAEGPAPSLLQPLPKRLRHTVYEATGIMAPARRQQRAEAIGSLLRTTITVVVFTVAALLICGELGIHLGPHRRARARVRRAEPGPGRDLRAVHAHGRSVRGR
jgi:short subunit dehydrogenase-like uncharacterized protein